MKKLIATLLLAVTLVSCGKSKTIDGKTYSCYGYFDKSEIKDPKIRYEFVTKNIIPIIIFSETLLMPILIIGYQSHCPVGKK